MDTIYALSSGGLPSGVAVIRLSGSRSLEIISALFSRSLVPRVMTYGSFKDHSNAILDHGLCVYFPGPQSFTGEDSAEFHVHGSKAVISAFMAHLSTFDNVRLAEQGEFSKRAFFNGKLDLTSAEALKDLIDAETESQRRFALSNANGAQKAVYSSWRDRILHARSMLEAELDFSDESDVPGSASAHIHNDMIALRDSIADQLSHAHRAEIVRDGYKVALVGNPNVGKSSLMNVLCRRDIAIVTDEAGTTRDVIQATLDIGGVKCILSDTAGIRENVGRVEALGIERTFAEIGDADFVLVLTEDGIVSDALKDALSGKDHLLVYSKKDIHQTVRGDGIHISALSGEGLPALLSEIERRAIDAVGDLSQVLPSKQRHLDLLSAAIAHIDNYLRSPVAELQAEELRRASDYIGRLTGAVEVEDILGHIFSTFCIGK